MLTPIHAGGKRPNDLPSSNTAVEDGQAGSCPLMSMHIPFCGVP